MHFDLFFDISKYISGFEDMIIKFHMFNKANIMMIDESHFISIIWMRNLHLPYMVTSRVVIVKQNPLECL